MPCCALCNYANIYCAIILFHRLELITGTGNLLDSMLHDAIFYRQSKATLYQSSSPPTVSDSVQPEFLPWTASDSRQGTRNCLMEQVRIGKL